MIKRLKGFYEPLEYARLCMSLDLLEKNKFKVRIRPGCVNGWAYFYVKDKKVWNCNLVFFKKHFVKVK